MDTPTSCFDVSHVAAAGGGPTDAALLDFEIRGVPHWSRWQRVIGEMETGNALVNEQIEQQCCQ
jgi:hypothetical protein